MSPGEKNPNGQRKKTWEIQGQTIKKQNNSKKKFKIERNSINYLSF